MSRSEERKKRGEFLGKLKALFAIGGVMLFLAVILSIYGRYSAAYAVTSVGLSVMVACGTILARLTREYDRQEERYGVVRNDPFAGYEKSMIEQAISLIRRIKTACGRGDE
jgi:hypothetical protein